MRTKTYKMRSRAAGTGQASSIDLPLEFEGTRAFAIWDSIKFGNLQFKARVEIDPTLLQKSEKLGCDYYYNGQLVLPRPENN
jgi:hypothetical protein